MLVQVGAHTTALEDQRMLVRAGRVLQVLEALDIQDLVDLHIMALAAPCIVGLAAPLQQRPVARPTPGLAELAMRDRVDRVIRVRVALGPLVPQFANEKLNETNTAIHICGIIPQVGCTFPLKEPKNLCRRSWDCLRCLHSMGA